MVTIDTRAQALAASQSRFLLARSVYKQRIAELFGMPSIFTRFYDRKQCIFVHIPKCAGTSIATLLYGQSPWHYSAADIVDINAIKWCHYYTFTTVRDPLTRLYSIYNYAHIDRRRYRFSPLRATAAMTFEEFVDSLNAELIHAFPFLRPQYRYVFVNDTPLVHAWIRVENLREELRPILNRFKVPDQVQFLNVTPQAGRAADAYDSRMRRKVELLYEPDRAIFGY